MTPKNERRFYVYAYLRSKDSKHGKKYSPYYIGKGTRDRAMSKLRTVPRPADKSLIVYVQEGLTEQEAFALEKYCIALYGRIDNGTGILRNLSDGGDGPSGVICTEEQRRKIAEAGRERRHSLETRQKIGDAQRGHKNHMWNKEVAQETRQKISAANSGLRRSAEARQNISKGKCKYKCVLLDPKGNSHKVDNLHQFCLDAGLHRKLMRQLVLGQRKFYKGWAVESVEILQ